MDRVLEVPTPQSRCLHMQSLKEVPLNFLSRYDNQLEGIGGIGDGRKPACALDHTISSFLDSASTTTFSNLESMIFFICPFSFNVDNGSNLGVTMPPDRINPLVAGELVRQISCSRKKINCEDGFQGVFVGEDS